ncbi:muscle-specific protein 20 isoform X1 [Neodiprion pinetum]|uniref:Transgelin n=1 Tax=Neodiprion lecontei TaxID=441921 RepID=A0ABM3FZ16_NEOLC|nr:muscle-specific protein 20-like isoform X1 [Neodiprion pinetum]XP_046593269.1 muscle-specific protein 20 isoform X1 [Neodiprion lecontei]
MKTKPCAKIHSREGDSTAAASRCSIRTRVVIYKRPRLSLVAGKREADQEAEAQQWIERVVGERFPAGISYEDALRDGVLLCRLMNKLQPGLITKINASGGDYKFMDNLNQFQKACVKYGVPDVDLFQAVDLMERKNIAQVTNTIFAIGRTTYKHPEWRGPWLGPKPSEENKRVFSEQQLRAGESVIGLQAGSNRGATQAGQSFGATRKILLGK